MASGPDHYKQAEADAAEADNLYAQGDEELAVTRLRFAKVHATLALAAATALNDGDTGLGQHDYTAWKAVAGAKKVEGGE